MADRALLSTPTRRLRLRSIALLALGALAPTTWAALPPPDVPRAEATIEFGDDVGAALAASAQDGRPVVVVFGAVWCPACSRFEEHTIATPRIQSFGADFHWVYVDIDSDVTLARKYEVDSTPRTIVLRPDGARLATAAGAFDSASFGDFLEAVKGATESTRLEDLIDLDETQLIWSPEGYRGMSICFSHVGYGPLNLPSQAPGQVLRLGLRPRTPSTLARGQYEVIWTESFANVFAYEESDFRLDYLTLNSTLSLAYGITDYVGVELGFGNLIRTNSFLDPITTGFHDLFGLGDSGRDQFSEGENVLDFDLTDDVEDTESGSEASNLTLSLLHNITCGTETWPALAYSISGRWDAGGNADLEGDSPFSFGMSVSASRRIGSAFYAYLGLGYTWHGSDESHGVAIVEEQWSGLAAVEWRYASDRAFVLQYLISEGVAVEREPFDKPSNELNVGWVWEFQPGTVFEFGVIENIVEADNSPDFGLHFGLRHRF